ncbi:hypothetical protein [Mesobacillus zeae]|uniref:hypothetical protein n=1 Tax=Mesobacillus zeae TaxID=1917180 RepID=UPI0015E70492|nr:hypothetical protein [Mesobacillus zeae]
MRIFKVINENNFYHGKEGILVRENAHDLILTIHVGDWNSDLPFDKSEVEEII